jgi:hypothetical protein
MRVKGNVYKIVAGRRPIGRLKHSWEENIKLDPEEMEFELDRFDSRERERWQTVMSTTMNFQVHKRQGIS